MTIKYLFHWQIPVSLVKRSTIIRPGFIYASTIWGNDAYRRNTESMKKHTYFKNIIKSLCSIRDLVKFMLPHLACTSISWIVVILDSLSPSSRTIIQTFRLDFSFSRIVSIVSNVIINFFFENILLSNIWSYKYQTTTQDHRYSSIITNFKAN